MAKTEVKKTAKPKDHPKKLDPKDFKAKIAFKFRDILTLCRKQIQRSGDPCSTAQQAKQDAEAAWEATCEELNKDIEEACNPPE